MALLGRLEKTKTESLHMRSERVLESDDSLLVLGASKAAGLLDEKIALPKFCLRLIDKNDGVCSEFIEESFGEWNIQQNGQDRGKSPISKELLDIILKEENPLMKKAILGITSQRRENGRYLGDLIQKGLSRVGLSVSKDGFVQETNLSQMQKGQERS